MYIYVKGQYILNYKLSKDLIIFYFLVLVASWETPL